MNMVKDLDVVLILIIESLWQKSVIADVMCADGGAKDKTFELSNVLHFWQQLTAERFTAVRQKTFKLLALRKVTKYCNDSPFSWITTRRKQFSESWNPDWAMITRAGMGYEGVDFIMHILCI